MKKSAFETVLRLMTVTKNSFRGVSAVFGWFL